ncbi:MAG TPA: YqeG family HAD IIIA-type phosphatase [Ruminococcaceae bacterium]|nr:YqeG family HAD IIIA-type phosphatase [Oscillospiraceae bacterium]
MRLFLPTLAADKVTDITPELIRSIGGSALLLDVDNTLAPHGSQVPFPGAAEWTRRMRDAGIKIIIMSNNFKKRVEPFAKKLGLPFISCSMKPLPGMYLNAVSSLGAERGDAVVVGDQVFTDILGANIARLKSILLTPRGEESSLSFSVRRALEKPVRKKIAEDKRFKG